MESKYLTGDYMKYVEGLKSGSDKYRRIYNQLGRENVGSIICRGNVVYVEGYTTPKYIVNDVEKWAISKGLSFIRC